MILTHSEGTNLVNSLRGDFDIEIECLILNSEYDSDIFDKLELYKKLKTRFPSNTVLKESSDHSEDSPSYELLVFCKAKEKDSVLKLLSKYEIELKTINYN